MATRSKTQTERVYTFMKKGVWKTLEQIRLKTKDPLPSISARLRDLRKDEYGAFTVDKRIKKNSSPKVFEYRVTE
jgi:hypothetical protein